MNLLWRDASRLRPRPSRLSRRRAPLPAVDYFAATKHRILPRRTNGLIQLTYSLQIGYALFLTVTQGEPPPGRGLSRLAPGDPSRLPCRGAMQACGPLSDAVRNVLYSRGIYENDIRDVFVLQAGQAEVLRLGALQRHPSATPCHLPVDGGEPLGAGSCWRMSASSDSACSPCRGRRVLLMPAADPALHVVPR